MVDNKQVNNYDVTQLYSVLLTKQVNCVPLISPYKVNIFNEGGPCSIIYLTVNFSKASHTLQYIYSQSRIN